MSPGLRWALRTLTRLRRIADRVDAEHLAVAIEPYYRDVLDLSVYLSDVAEYLDRARQPGYRPCAACQMKINGAFYTARRDARYCSHACRQRAYRQRVTARRAARATQASRRDGSHAPYKARAVTPSEDAA